MVFTIDAEHLQVRVCFQESLSRADCVCVRVRVRVRACLCLSIPFMRQLKPSSGLIAAVTISSIAIDEIGQSLGQGFQLIALIKSCFYFLDSTRD